MHFSPKELIGFFFLQLESFHPLILTQQLSKQYIVHFPWIAHPQTKQLLVCQLRAVCKMLSELQYDSSFLYTIQESVLEVEALYLSCIYALHSIDCMILYKKFSFYYKTLLGTVILNVFDNTQDIVGISGFKII